MKKLDRNQKISVSSLAIWVILFIGFSVLIGLVQGERLPDLTMSQSIQGILILVMFLPLFTAIFFAGRHFKSKNSKIGGVLIFVSVALLIFGILQALLSLLGAYGS